jgi:RND family efflux transporter MFP subunit
MRIFVILGILLLAFAAAAAMFSMREPPPKKERVDIDPLVTTLTLETMTANFEVHAQGVVRPRTQTQISAEVAGIIVSISPEFVAGGVFGENEVLMRIDPTNYSVAVDQAQALVSQRQIEYDGASKLRSQGYRAESEFASAAALLASAKAELVRARRNLERTYIRMPYAGIVREKNTDLGQFVSAGIRVGVVFATEFAEIRLALTDLDLAILDLPATRQLHADSAMQGPAVELAAVQKGQFSNWQAQIVRTEGVIDEASRMTYAVARVVDPYSLHRNGPALPFGTFVEATIQGRSTEGIIRVPRSAIRASNQLLVVDDDSKVVIRKIEIVRSDTDYSYLRAGVTAGEIVIISALEAAVQGMSVRTNTADET